MIVSCLRFLQCTHKPHPYPILTFSYQTRSLLPHKDEPTNWNTTHSFILSNPLLSLLEKCKSMNQVKQIQTQMIITGLILDGLAASRLVAFCAISESKNLDYCKRILNNLRSPNVFSWNVMIRGYCESEKPEESLLLYKEMLRRSNALRPDNHTYPLLLKCCAKLSLIRMGFSVIGHVIHLGFESDVYVNNAVIHLLVSCGELDEAHKVFSESCVRDLVSWNSIIYGHVRSGKPLEALRLYRQMEEEGITPDEVTMIGMISSCAQLENLNLGRKLHQCIEENRIKMTVPLGNALMDMYVKCGNMDAAESLFDKMTRKTIVSWTTMIVGYGKYGHIDVAKKLFVEMPEKNVVSCNAMIGGYIQAKYFEDALATFHEMQVIKALFSDYFEGQDFFETSTMLISFILLGKYLESMAKGKTSDALAKIMSLAPDTACLVKMSNEETILSETEINPRLIERNDILKIFPGSKFPVDGIVVNGEGYVNESMITGEAIPVAKIPGDRVIGGTVNENGCLLIKATHVGSETALSQIVQIVEDAQLARAPVQKLADQISKYFVPVVVVAAVATWLGWFIPGVVGIYPKSWIPKAMDEFELALQFGISVLVVACPCALGLATPTAIMVATGKGASQGVLIKGGNALEKAHKVNTVVFDKTGTLTIGKPEVVSAVLFSGISMEEFCNTAIVVEANSEHPIAKAIVEYAKNRLHNNKTQTTNSSVVKDFKVHPGAGVECKLAAKMVLVGNKRLMRSFNILISPEAETYFSDNENLARTCVLFAIDGKIVGAVAVTDPVKPEAARVVSYLRSMNVRSIMVTGDNWATANSIATELGIENVFAETDPLGKADKIKELQAKGMIVAMVGDGINDSPALVAANVGMAIGAGTDVAIEAADIVLIKSNLEDVITAIDSSMKTISRIYLNYVWALGYNVLGVPVAAGILFPFMGIRLPPWLAGACMAASSVSVVCSSLLLQTYKKPFAYSRY